MFQAIIDKIKDYPTIIIHRHVRPDPDAYGSQQGLAELIKAAFPDKKVLLPGFQEPSLDWMANMDQVADSDYEGALVIVTDTANQPRIDDQRYDMGDFLIKIDHHPNEEPYGDLVYVDTKVSSCSEIITALSLAYPDLLPMTEAAAFYLYAGILGDTGRFLHSSTKKSTFEVAAFLSDYTDISEIAQKMSIRTRKELSVIGYVLSHAKISEAGVSHVILDRDTMAKLGVIDAETASAVGSQGQIEGVYAWVLFVEQEEGHYRCRIRSKGPIINEIAKAHGGGGHPMASGANAYSFEEIKEILDQLDQASLSYQK